MSSPVFDVLPLGFPWVTADPFLFCVHHDDAYPAGDERMGPPASMLAGRNLGQDFEIKDGFRMYHGDVVPGFPQHPHRGFETVTIVRRGFIDHSDSLGAAARFGRGDVQWLTAGAGICHSEMFPLLEADAPNPVELFQIWLNLPAADKMAPPHFSMLWSHDIPTVRQTDERGRGSAITVVAGTFGGEKAPPPPPRSWASRPDTDVAIACLALEPGAKLHLPRAAGGEATGRVLYFFAGPSVDVGGHAARSHAALAVDADRDLDLVAGDGRVELLLLQGRPIDEPVAQAGPFVMNTREEIQQAFADFQNGRLG